MNLVVLIEFFLVVYLFLIYARRKYIYLHTLFIIPLYPIIFFVDHNIQVFFNDAVPDSFNILFKLLPLYVNQIILLLDFKCSRGAKSGAIKYLSNIFVIYNVIVALGVLTFTSNYLPLFYVSYSAPFFLLYLNSRNVEDDIKNIRSKDSIDLFLIKLCFMLFVTIYAVSIAYSIYTERTSSLLESRNVGSIYASTSALVYCILFAPLLAYIAKIRWPYFIALLISLVSLSKTSFLMMPGFIMIILNKFKKFTIQNFAYTSVGSFVIIFLLILIVPESLLEQWKVKFYLEPGESIIDKSYMTRLIIFTDALEAIQNTVFGYGVGSFESFSSEGYKDAHNFLLTTFVESGVVGGCLVSLITILGMIDVLRRMFDGKFDYVDFTFITITLVFTLAGGVLLTTGEPSIQVVYYTPFYGVMYFLMLNLISSRNIKTGR